MGRAPRFKTAISTEARIISPYFAGGQRLPDYIVPNLDGSLRKKKKTNEHQLCFVVSIQGRSQELNVAITRTVQIISTHAYIWRD